MSGRRRWKFERDLQQQEKVATRCRRQTAISFKLDYKLLEFLQRKSEEQTAKLGKVVNTSHVLRALIRQAMAEENERKRVWDVDLQASA